MKLKVFIALTLLVGLTTNLFASKIDFNLKNTTEVELQVFYQIIDGIELDNPEFVFTIPAKGQRTVVLKVKRGQKIKIIGYGSGIESLPIVKSYDNLTSEVNHIELVLPKVEKLNVIELNEALSKLKNDTYLNILMDSAIYAQDRLPVLGTIIFFNLKDNATINLNPSYWKNENKIRSIQEQHFETVDYVNSSNAAGLNVSGVPFLQKLSASMSNTNMLEIVWKVNNAHIEQWQPNDKNVFDIIQDPSNRPFFDACIQEMNYKKLGGGDYKLYFISSALVANSIVVSAKKYNKVVIDVNVDFQTTPNTEVVKPVGIQANYGYTREKLYSNIDSSRNVYLKFMALDYTPALNTYINNTAKEAQKAVANANITKLVPEIVNQYTVLQNIDNTLISSNKVEVILPIVSITSELTVLPEQYDSLGNNITAQEAINANKKARQFNSILANLKASIEQYKASFESIEKLGQPTDYYKVMNSFEPHELDKKVVESFVKVKENKVTRN
jgi:hypothetical protein